MKRRNFLKGLGATVALTGLMPFQNFAFRQNKLTNHSDEIFVFVFLRGGCDALNLVGPVGNKIYNNARGQGLRVSERGNMSLKGGLDGQSFNLHAQAKPLLELYKSGDLAVIHACGLQHGTRSHFDAQDLIERGLNAKNGRARGWMTRYFEQQQIDGALPAVAIGGGMPASFLGCSTAISMENVNEFDVFGETVGKEVLAEMYGGNNFLDQTAQRTLKTIQLIQGKIKKNGDGDPYPYHAEHGADYPEEWHIEDFSSALKNLAQLIKMDVGVHMASVEYGGWDTHEHQEANFGQKVTGFSRALMAFYNDMQHYHKRMTILVMSEFGRRLKSNRSAGTDHGYGGVAFALGGNVKGGKMYGQWPGLETHQLDNGLDLGITTDYRAILGEVLDKRLGVKNIDTIFPKFKSQNHLGFLA